MNTSPAPTPTPSSETPRPLLPGPLGGLQVLVEALLAAIRPPTLWMAAVPFCLNLLLGIALVWGASSWWPAFTRDLPAAAGWLDWFKAGLIHLQVFLTALGTRIGTMFAAFVVSLLLVEPLCGLLGITDRLVLYQLTALTPGTSVPPVPLATMIRRSLLAVSIGLFLQVPALLASLFSFGLGFIPFLGPLISLPLGLFGWVLAGVLQAWNLLDYPFSLAGLRIRDRLAFVAGNPGKVLGLGLPLAFCSLFLLPVVLPVGVIAATRLFVKIRTPGNAPSA